MKKLTDFVVYHVNTTIETKSFARAHHAFACMSRLNAKARARAARDDRPRGGDEYAVAPRDMYLKHVVYTVTRRNARSGQLFEEPSNTPYYLSPSSETYWSM